MHAVEVAGEEAGDDAAAAAPSLRRARLEASGEAVGRAQGSGWAAANRSARMRGVRRRRLPTLKASACTE